jgi:hypothetical protein
MDRSRTPRAAAPPRPKPAPAPAAALPPRRRTQPPAPVRRRQAAEAPRTAASFSEGAAAAGGGGGGKREPARGGKVAALMAVTRPHSPSASALLKGRGLLTGIVHITVPVYRRPQAVCRQAAGVNENHRRQGERRTSHKKGLFAGRLCFFSPRGAYSLDSDPIHHQRF